MNTKQNKPGHTRSVNSNISASAQARFLSYLCTRYLLNYSRPKNDQDTTTGKWVHIPERPQKERPNRRYIDGDLIPYVKGAPGAWRQIIDGLMQSGAIKRKKVDNQNTRHAPYLYAPGNIDPLQYFTPKAVKNERAALNALHTYMANCMPLFKLSESANKAFLLHLKGKSPERYTKYLTAFKYMEHAPELFLKVDDFAQRVHTPFSSMETVARPHIEYNGQKAVNFDIATSQPLILAEILHRKIGRNDFTQWVHQGHDVYAIMADIARLDNRSDGKALFFQLIFAPPKKELETMFPGANWVQWLNQAKGGKWEHPTNGQYSKKGYNIIAYYLQSTESKIMRMVWERIAADKAPFLSVHDEIVVPPSYADRAHAIMADVMHNNYLMPMPHAQIKRGKGAIGIPAQYLDNESAKLCAYIDPLDIERIDSMTDPHDLDKQAIQWGQAERIIYQARAENNK